MFVLVLVSLLIQAAAAPAAQAPDARALTLSPPKAVLELDAGRLQGDLTRLAWGPDGRMYVRATQVDRWGNQRNKHYQVTTKGASAAAPEPIDSEPPWASDYWLWKSSSFAPGKPDLKFDLDVQQEVKTPTAVLKDDGLSQSGGDPSRPRVQGAIEGAQTVRTTTVKLKGEVIAEMVNATLVPGQTFGWAPSPMAVLAYTDRTRHLNLIDRDGHKREVAGATDALLPAWSPDGKQIAYLAKKGGKKYALMVIDVSGQ